MIELSDKTAAAADIYAGTSDLTHDTLAEYPTIHKVYLRVMFTDNDQAGSSRTMRVFVTSGGGANTYVDATVFLKTPADAGEPGFFTLGPILAGGDEDLRLRISESDNPEDIDISVRAWLLSDDIDYALSWIAATGAPETDSLTERVKAFDTAAASVEVLRRAVVVNSTTIATIDPSQTSFTLTAGSADNKAYYGCLAVIRDSATATQRCVGYVKTYTGASKTITLAADPGVFTMAVGDTVDLIPSSALATWDELLAGHAIPASAGATLAGAADQDSADTIVDTTDGIRGVVDAIQAATGVLNRALVMHSTTIATIDPSQTSFTLTTGSPDDDAYIGCLVLVKDVTTPYQRCVGYVQAYTGASKMITLAADPGVFTMAVGDTVDLIPSSALAAWDELIAGHAGAGTAGAALIAAAAGADPAAVADAVWDELIAGHAGAGSIGALLSAIRAKTDLIGAVSVTYTSPAATGGTFAIVGGDDYLAADSRALTITISDYSGPDLTAAAAVFRLVAVADRAAGSMAAELDVAATLAIDGTTITATVELTSAQTAALEASPPAAHYNYAWQLRATTAGGTILTPAAGLLHVEPGVT